MTRTDTHCPYCALQCGMALSPTTPSQDDVGRRVPLEVTPLDFPTNRGRLCRKGWSSAQVLGVGDRLTTPLLRRGGKSGELAPATWGEAFDVIAEAVHRASAGGREPDRVGVFGGGGLTNEKAYMLGKFARLGLGTSQIDYNGRWCMSSAAAGAARCFGLDRGMPFPLADLDDAEAILLVGANPAETMPPMVTHLDTARESGGLMVVDPRRSATARLADEAGGVHLQNRPGTDAALAAGLLHIAVTRGWADRDYIRDRTSGFDDAWAVASQWLPERTEAVTGVGVPALRAAVERLATAARAGRGAYILTARGAEQSSRGTDTVATWIALALALGLPGRKRSGWGTITGQGNGQGGREHGQKCDQLPGYRKITDPAARAHVAAVWGVDPDAIPGPGRSAFELLDACGRDVAADGRPGVQMLFVHASNPVVSAPDAARVAERLDTLDTLVVADFVPSETAQLADVVLPVRQWAEEEGTVTNLEGRVLRRRRAAEPPAGTRDELEILRALAERLGRPAHWFPTDPAEVFDELARASAGGAADYSAISHARLDAGEALHWPCGADSPGGTPRLFLGSFATADGRAVFSLDVGAPDTFDTRVAERQVVLTTGRLLGHYQSGAQTRRVPELHRTDPEATATMHPDTATSFDLADGVMVRIRGRAGSIEARVLLDPTSRRDTVFVPFHFPGAGRANLATEASLDPHSRMPDFKVNNVTMEAI
ncbi:molybdopterin oxidoreductase family protein [Dietzia timorensis]|uniref:Assimilatory nitrate reductase catalytic subunit n=3 Tax=Dietzia timorensis TaxID=499555 RepID=A0A173LMQ5_9ACTN|nr:molybdopterin oxidoreductase family protein [Dietzia timorensis]ANI93556.1 Assimilatory nitrate reductase catalytic subunit [Dietzia timorensis]